MSKNTLTGLLLPAPYITLAQPNALLP